MIQNKVTLNLGGKDRTFHLGLGFVGYLLEEENIGFIEFGEKEQLNPFKWTPIKMYYSLKYYFIRLEQEDKIDFNLKDVIQWIDDTNVQTLQKFNQAYQLALSKDVPVETDKKKVKVAK